MTQAWFTQGKLSQGKTQAQLTQGKPSQGGNWGLLHQSIGGKDKQSIPYVNLFPVTDKCNLPQIYTMILQEACRWRKLKDIISNKWLFGE